MSDYLSIPLSKRLEAFRRNGKQRLGGGWHTESSCEPGKKQWHWVPEGTSSSNACWDSGIFRVGGDGCRACSDLAGYFREVKVSGQPGRESTGWYVDMHGATTTHALVLQLPARNKAAQFMAACSDPFNPNSGIVEQRIYADADEAAQSADGLATRFAEDCREDDLKQTAEFRVEELQQEIMDTREYVRELLAGLRQSTLALVVCEAMRKTVRALREDVRQAKLRIAEIQENPSVLLN